MATRPLITLIKLADNADNYLKRADRADMERTITVYCNLIRDYPKWEGQLVNFLVPVATQQMFWEWNGSIIS